MPRSTPRHKVNASLTFAVNGPPVGINESNRMGRGRWYKTPEFKDYKERVRSVAKGYALASKFPVADGPVEVSITVYNCGHDVDAIGKVILDALETVCYPNDKLVTRLLQETKSDDGVQRVVISVKH